MTPKKLGDIKFSLLLCVLPISGCSDYDPVPKSQCSNVVQHAQKVLGEFSPSYPEMVNDCKSATDKERGCIMASTTKGQILQCM
ncbi:MAG: hypothetical protein JKY66_08900 [Spongiibacteraceae bacterium]|nr:hypothetical protein [Spongiibacteraceae bacterium]